MFSTQTVESLWPNTGNKPSLAVWSRWKRTFCDYIELLLALNPTIQLSEDQRIKLLRQHLGSEGQRHFDALRIYEQQSLKDALVMLDGIWGLRRHVHTARLMLHKLHQQSDESVNDFIIRIQQALPDCRYQEVPPSKFEEVMATQCLLAGISDEKARERLLSTEDSALSWEKACDIVRQRENVVEQLSCYKKEPTTEIVQVIAPGKSTQMLNSSRGFTCYRCGAKHTTPTECRHIQSVCHKCGKKGHIARVCRSKATTPMGTDRIKAVEQQEEDICYLISHASLTRSPVVPPYSIHLRIEGQLVKMEIDTGASVTIINDHDLPKRPPLTATSATLQTYTGQPITVLGACHVRVRHESKDISLPIFVVRNKGPNLLGRDWLKQLPELIQFIHNIGITDQLDQLLTKFAPVFQEDQVGKLVDYQATLNVRPQAQGRFFKARSLPFSIRPKVEEELRRLEEQNVITAVRHSDWAAPIVPVQKPDGSVRICGDYKLTINREAVVEQYPIPRIEDLYATLAGGVKFSKLDLSHAYSQIELQEQSRTYTTINTHLGLFQYNRLPFGVNSAPAIFQRVIDNLVKNIPNVCAYLDDILISGPDEHTHLHALQTVLSRLCESGLKLKKSKCEFFADSVQYLGYRLDKHGLQPIREKLRPILDAPAPRNVGELQSFLGMLTHYGRFIPRSSTLLHPLHTLLRKDSKWKWTQEQQTAFTAIKKALEQSDLLIHFDPQKPLIVRCDASPWGVGAVLLHRMEDASERPIAFASRSLLPAEKNYAQLDREALAAIFSVKKFHQYLWGRFFELQTDHKPLLSLIGESKGVNQMASPRMQRWALLLSAYNYKISYIPGTKNKVADAMSRLPLTDVPETVFKPKEIVNLVQHMNEGPVTFTDIRRETERDITLAKIKRFLTHGWPQTTEGQVAGFTQRKDELSLEDGCILWGSRIVVPPCLRPPILAEVHTAHPGICRMKSLARDYVWWPKIDEDIDQLVHTCDICQRLQKNVSPVPLNPWSWPEKPWQRVHADYFGPIDNKMFLLMIDAHSKWIEVYPVTNANSKTTVSCMRTSFSTFGIPQTLVTDNGTPFTSEEFKVFVQGNGIRHVRSPPYHPASNGLAERAVQTVKQGLLKQQLGTIRTKLARFLLSYRTTPTESTRKSPAEMMFGRKLRTRLSLVFPEPKVDIMEKQEKMKERYDKRAKDRHFQEEELVYTKLPHELSWEPGIVKSTNGQESGIELPDGRVVTRHNDQVRARQVSDISPDERTPSVVRNHTSEDENTAPEHALRRSSRESKPVARFQAG